MKIMFSFFKKKPIEVKYGRTNYVDNDYKADDRAWILLLSSVFIEAKDMEIGLKKAEHGRLEIYPKEMLDEEEKKSLKFDLVTENISKVKLRMEQVSDLNARLFETDVYYVVNCNSLEEVRAKAEEEYEGDKEKLKLFEYIWERREIYEKSFFRLGFIAQSIWQIRLSAYFGVIHEDVAWTHLETLADFARPLMTLFSSWEEYNLNIQQFHEIFEFKYPDERKFIDKAVICLNKREESPCAIVPYDLGVDKSYPYNIETHSNRYAKQISTSEDPDSLMLLELMEREDKSTLWKVLDNYSLEKRNLELAIFINECAVNIKEEDLIELPELYPDNYYAYLIRSSYFDKFAWDARGTGVSNTVGRENYNLFFERLEWELNDLLKAHELNPKDSTVWGNIYATAIHFKTEDKKALVNKMYKLIREEALEHLFCVNIVETFKRERWMGYKGENLDWAREVVANTPRGAVSKVIIFSVIQEHYNYKIMCGEEEEEASKIFKDKQIQAELNQYLDEVLENIDNIPYTIADKLVWWYLNVKDFHRLRQVMRTIKEGKFSEDSINGDYSDEYTELLMHWFRSI